MKAKVAAVLVAGIIGLSAPPASAEEEDLPAKAPTTFEECARVPRDEERLACYDEIANNQFPDTMEKMREARETKKKKDFGLFLPGPGQELDELEVTFVNVRKNPYGKVVLTTAEGQIWVQTDDKSLAYKQPIKGVIKKGLMGSYIFSPESKDRAIKVERIR